VWSGPEFEALRLLVSRADEIGSWLHPALFHQELLRAAFDALTENGGVRDAIAWADEADPEVAEVLHQAAATDSDADARDVVSRLVEEAARRALRETEAEARVADDPLAFNDVTVWLKHELELLHDERAGFDVVEGLLTWLTDQSEDSHE
jgi:hypothetical protein